MKKICIWLMMLLISIATYSEAFDITNYFIDMKMNTDGSIWITETIDVHFKDQRHGIIRSIPFRYRQYEFPGREKAQRASISADYQLLIKYVTVEGFEFSTYYEGDFLKIKIGSADKYVEGNQKFIIKYQVWGGLNKFSDHTELYWNLIGHQWDCTIEKAGFNISLPKSLNLTNNDILLFTGVEGTKDQGAKFSLNATSISGSLINSLKPNEGMTVVVRFPLSYFTNTSAPVEDLAKSFYIDKLQAKIRINADASLDVEEKYSVTLLYPQTSFIRDFYTLKTDDSSIVKDLIIKDLTVNYVSDKVTDAQFSAKTEGENKYVTLFSNTKKFSCKLEVTLRYKVWGAVTFANGLADIRWPFTGEMSGEPFKNLEAEIGADPAINIEKTIFRFYRGYEDYAISPDISYDSKKKTYFFKYDKVFATDAITMTETLSDAGFSKNKMPMEVFANRYYINDFLTEITLKKNGSIHVKHWYHVKFKNPYSTDNSFTAKENFSYYENLSIEQASNTGLPDWSFLSGYTRLLVSNLNVRGQHDGYRYGDDYFNTIYWFATSGTQQDNLYSYEYDIFGLMTKKDGKYHLKKALLSPFYEPVKTGTIRIILPDGINPADVDAAFLINGDIDNQLKFTTGKNTLICKLSQPLYDNETPMLLMNIAKDKLSVSGWLTWRVIWKNNRVLFYPVIVFIILLILWFFIGRDRKDTLVVQYNPPKDITPAEAGYIWDNKLHKRDLVSLIYYWAGNGLLSIKEIKSSGTGIDYELTKLKDLSREAKSFEKKMFNGLFKEGQHDPVKVSSLKNSFFVTMDETDKDLRSYSRANNFFVPGILGFGIFLKVIAFFVLIIGFFAALFSGHSILQSQICVFLLFGIIYLFGRIMPKRAHFGADKFAQLLGFREFIERAESDKLKGLLQENPKYFDETVAYAIVMGLGTQWAEKFKDLINSAPDWYQSADPHAFSTTFLISSMVSSMYHMDHNFNYHYTPPSSGSGFHSSGFSSFGGGGGFSGFGGGGFSGGGFGGGGGSSW